ncbi:hypothetical protein [Rhizocola hellebori]|nr:hypothetical protein [Rhizocola hellebori]
MSSAPAPSNLSTLDRRINSKRLAGPSMGPVAEMSYDEVKAHLRDLARG